jgi:PAS domain S-box-containing protein
MKRVHPDDVAKAQKALDDAARDATNLDFEHRLLMPDGSVKYVHVLARAVKAETGILEFIGAVMEITERKNTEESLRRNETYLAEAQKLSKTGSFCLRSGGQEMICSEETVRIGGWAPGTKPTLEQAFERVHPEDRLRVQTALGKALQEGSYLEYEHRLLMPDGSVRHVHTVANSIRTASGQVEYVGAVMDITESEKAAEALDAAEHLARGQLEALVGSLTTLSQEPKPEKFLEHVLHLICKQLGAEGIGGWELNSKIGYVDLAANYENGRLLLPTPEEIQVLPQEAIAPENHLIWEEFFRGEGDRAFVEEMLSAYDTEKRLQAQGLAPEFSIEDVVIEAGPSYFDSAVKQVGEGIDSITTTLGNRSTAPYTSTGK